MAFDGTLLKIGNYMIDGTKYINYNSYKVTRNVQDLDSYRDANGVLHRNALSHIPVKVELSTRENLTNLELSTFLGSIQANFKNNLERKVSVKIYVPEIDDYITQDMYMADPEIAIKRISGRIIYYQPVRIAFIGY